MFYSYDLYVILNSFFKFVNVVNNEILFYTIYLTGDCVICKKFTPRSVSAEDKRHDSKGD